MKSGLNHVAVENLKTASPALQHGGEVLGQSYSTTFTIGCVESVR